MVENRLAGIITNKKPQTPNLIKTTKNLAIISLLLLLTTAAFGQQKVKYQDDYDNKDFHFGFLIGVGQTSYKVRTNRTFQQPINDQLFSITSPPAYYLRLGGLMNVRLNDHFDFRILPAVSIYSRNLILSDSSARTDDLISLKDKAWLELPVAIKYKSERRGNIRMYMFAGFRYGKETNAINFVNRAVPRNVVETKGSDFSVEYGVGLESFMRFFKFTPELHFSHGLNNALKPTVSDQITPNKLIQKMNTHTVTLVFMFE